MASSSSTTTWTPALLLLALIHTSLTWDSSNVWFPDTNNPVFYNMTFYNQAAQSINAEPPPSDNLIPPTEPPRFSTNNHRQRPRPPPVFNALPETVTRTPVRPTQTETPQFNRPNQNRFTTNSPNLGQRQQPNRNRQPSNTNGRLQGGQSEFSKLAVETEKFIRNEQNSQNFRKPSANRPPQSGISKLAAEQQLFIRNEQNNQRVRDPSEGTKVSSQSGIRRAEQQHNMFVRNEQGFNAPDFYPVPVGYKTVPLEVTTSYYDANEKTNQKFSGNRLRRTKNEGIADGGNYYNRNNGGGENGGQFAEEQRQWNGDRDAILSQTRPMQREENRRRWSSAGTTGSDVATNVIADVESSSKATGPSKCVWAIISCCKPASSQIRYTCFETLGCHGAFWDTNPCSKEMTLAAVHATANFYKIPPRTED